MVLPGTIDDRRAREGHCKACAGRHDRRREGRGRRGAEEDGRGRPRGGRRPRGRPLPEVRPPRRRPPRPGRARPPEVALPGLRPLLHRLDAGARELVEARAVAVGGARGVHGGRRAAARRRGALRGEPAHGVVHAHEGVRGDVGGPRPLPLRRGDRGAGRRHHGPGVALGRRPVRDAEAAAPARRRGHGRRLRRARVRARRGELARRRLRRGLLPRAGDEGARARDARGQGRRRVGPGHRRALGLVSVNLFFTSFAKQARRSRKGGFTGCANVFSPIPVTA